MIKKLVLSILILPLLAQADIADKMDSFFDNTTVANFTSPVAVHSQEANYLSGGNANIKTNVSNMQLARVQLPSINAGCGGINLYAGGFSFINSDQLIAFGKNILSSAIPVAVDLALQTWAPSIAAIKNKFQSYAEAINNFNMSSCQAAELGVDGLAAASGNQELMKHACQSLSSQDNEYADWLSTRSHCSSPKGIAESSQKAKEEHKNYSVIAPNRNIAWYILNNPSKMDADVAQYLISLVGTVSYGSSVDQYQVYPGLFKTANSPIIKGFMDGGDVVEYKCSSTSKADGAANSDAGCVTMSKNKINIPANKSMIHKVEITLNLIINGLQNGKDLTSDQEKMVSAFGNIPVITDIRNSLTLHRNINTYLYAKYLSSQVMENYISNLMDQLDSSIASNQPGQEIIQTIRDNATKVSQALAKQSSDAKTDILVEAQYYDTQANKQKEVDNAKTAQAHR